MTGDHSIRFVDLGRLGTGRRLYALARLAEVIAERGVTALQGWVEGAREHERATRYVELRRRHAGGEPAHGPRAAALRAELERALEALDEGLAAQVAGLGRDSGRGRIASGLREELFPDGLSAVASLDLAALHEAVAALVDRLESPEDLSGEVEALGIEHLVDRLADLHARYGAELRAPVGRSRVDEILTLREMGHANLARIVALILALYAEDTERDAEARAALLDPIAAQHLAARRLRGRRRSVADVDPSAGEDEVEDDVADALPEDELVRAVADAVAAPAPPSEPAEPAEPRRLAG